MLRRVWRTNVEFLSGGKRVEVVVLITALLEDCTDRSTLVQSLSKNFNPIKQLSMFWKLKT